MGFEVVFLFLKGYFAASVNYRGRDIIQMVEVLVHIILEKIDGPLFQYTTGIPHY